MISQSPSWFWSLFNSNWPYYQNNMIDSCSISVRSYLPFVLEGLFYSYPWSCSLCNGKTSLGTGLISMDSYVFLRTFLQSVLYFFYLYQSPFSSFSTVSESISSKKDKILSVKPSANIFVFGVLMSITRTK